MRQTFTVPGTPVGKGRPRFTRTGHAYTPEKTRDYEDLVRSCYADQCGDVRLAGPVRAWIRANFRAPKRGKKSLHVSRPDADNLAKAVLDALVGVAYRDDSQVADLVVHKRYGAEPCVLVILDELEGDELGCP